VPNSANAGGGIDAEQIRVVWKIPKTYTKSLWLGDAPGRTGPCLQIASSPREIFQTTRHLFGVDSPAGIALFGTDGFGATKFSRVLYGGQISVAAGIAATLIALLAGALFGVIAGYYGNWTDQSLMAGTEYSYLCPGSISCWEVRAFPPSTCKSRPHFFPADLCHRPHRMGAPRPPGARNRSQFTHPQLRARRAQFWRLGPAT